MARQAPPRVVNVVYALLVIPYFLGLCSPNGEVDDASFGLVLLVILFSLAGWATAFLVHLAVRGIVVLKRYHQPRWRWSWLVIPLVLTGCIGLQQSGILWWWRWQHARSSFATAAGRPSSADQPGWIGTFHVRRIERDPSGEVRFMLGFPDLYADGPPALIYLPSGRKWAGNVRIDLGGGWWCFFDNT